MSVLSLAVIAKTFSLSEIERLLILKRAELKLGRLEAKREKSPGN